jgi:transposase
MMRKSHSAGFKFKVALAAAKGDQTIADICRDYEVAQSVVPKRKKELLAHGGEVFTDGKQARCTEAGLE